MRLLPHPRPCERRVKRIPRHGWRLGTGGLLGEDSFTARLRRMGQAEADAAKVLPERDIKGILLRSGIGQVVTTGPLQHFRCSDGPFLHLLFRKIRAAVAGEVESVPV